MTGIAFRGSCVIRVGDCRERMADIPSGSAQLCVTSPPYLGLRDYGVEGQIGLEQSIENHLDDLVEVFRSVARALRDDGVAFVNYGDAYASKAGGKLKAKDLMLLPYRLALRLQADGWYVRSDIVWAKPNPLPQGCADRPTASHESIFMLTKRAKYYYDRDGYREQRTGAVKDGETSERDMRDVVSIPDDAWREFYAWRRWRRAALEGDAADAWTMPTSGFSGKHFATFPPELVERCVALGTSAAGACPDCGAPWRRVVEATGGSIGKAWNDHQDELERGHRKASTANYNRETLGWAPTCRDGCNTGDEAREQIEEGGKPLERDVALAWTTPSTVLDPFGGSGTTGLVALRMGRSAILCELSEEYAAMARSRIYNDAPMFADVELV